eukprot:6284468-Heterocapsa_arctica.AAC.1
MLGMLEKRQKKKGNGEDGDGDEDAIGGKAAKAVRGMKALRRRLKQHPKEVVKEFQDQVRASLGAADGRSWIYWDYNRWIAWGKLFDLKRAYFMVSAINRLHDVGEADHTHAFSVRTLKALEQVALNQGNWKAA